MTKKLQIAVIGSAGWEEYDLAKPDSSMYKAAEIIGELLGERGCIVVNGGKGGVMEAVCRGAKRGGGITVAETSGKDRNTANKYVDVEIVTGDIAFRGPSQLVGMSDGVISLGGGAGTLQELAVAYRMQKPVVLLRGYGGWTDKLTKTDFLDERQLIAFEVTNDPQSAVGKLMTMLK